MPNAVYKHDIEAWTENDAARTVVVYFDAAVMEVMAFRLAARPGAFANKTTTFYKSHEVHQDVHFHPEDEYNGMERAVSYHKLWRMGVRRYQVWGKTAVGRWKAESGVLKMGDPAVAKS